MQCVTICLAYSSLSPTAVPEVRLLGYGIHHVSNLKVSPPLLVLVSESLELFLWDLIVVEVENRVVSEQVLNTVEKATIMLTNFQHSDEEENVILMDVCDHIKVL